MLLALAASLSHGQTAGDGDLNQAYQALAGKDYDQAIGLFRSGLSKQPQNAAAHKDLAYTLLKVGENAGARDEFEAALQIDKHDEIAALEFAFLAYETNKPVEARRTFDRLRHSGNAATRAKAEEAFRNIDGPLAEGIARWQQALERSPNSNDISTFSAHWELARLAEQRDQLPLAAEQYQICWALKPHRSELLLALARVWQQLNRVEEARAAVLAASRSTDARTAESALEQLGPRYPYPYEFLAALKIDPKNTALRRELGFLHLAMNNREEAIAQFELLLTLDPHDHLVRRQLDALRGIKSRPEPDDVPRPAASQKDGDAPPAGDPKTMGKKSLALGYLPDAIRYLRQAHEQDPDDAEVMLKLGWAYNQAKDDADAIEWFDRARYSGNPQIAGEASKAFHNLRGDTPSQTTLWTLPMYSLRWHDVFTYGQIKRTLPLPWNSVNHLLSFYISTRFMGDLQSIREAGTLSPQYLSETSLIFALGVSSKTWHHLTAWAEAGEAVNFLSQRTDVGAAIPDYRGGLNFARGFGHLLGSNTRGLFYETNADAVYVHRFDKDWLFYSQHRAGQTFRAWGGTAAQALFNVNYLRDVKNEYWANTVEFGPGMRVHLPWMPPNVYLSTDFLRGFYTNPDYKRPSYNDIRVGLWYAFTK